MRYLSDQQKVIGPFGRFQRAPQMLYRLKLARHATLLAGRYPTDIQRLKLPGIDFSSSDYLI